VCAEQATAVDAPQNIGDVLMRVSDLELANLKRIDAEVKQIKGEQRILDLEQYQDDAEYTNRKHKRAVRKELHANRQRKAERELDAHMQTIAQRHDLDVEQMSVDERTGIIRDLRSDAKKSEAPASSEVGPN
jgi:hypothetical protein